MNNLIFRLILFIFLLIFSGNYLMAGNTPISQEIRLDKNNPTGPSRAPSIYPVSFAGSIFIDEITISTQNYNDEITVQISGTNGSIVQVVEISDSQNAVIDISSLTEGEYTIDIITNGKGTFKGDFEI